jgi:tripartite-type tricarboxylate transporter receptor subunit TctC
MKSMFVLGMVTALLFSSLVAAQDYPARVITIIVPFPAGGPTDVVARLIAQAMSLDLKQTVIVENVSGAAGTIGAARAARAAPDGYTLLLNNSSHAIGPAINRSNLTYDPMESFEPVGLINDVPQAIVGKRDLGPKDMTELLRLIKQKGAELTMANAGVGSASHLCGLLFMKAINSSLTPVPYRGTAPAVNDLMGSQVDLLCDQTSNTGKQVEAGKIKAYCVATKNRVASWPTVPTCSEGGIPNFEASVWHALFAPKGTPKSVVDKLNASLQVALRDEQVGRRFNDLGTEPMPKERATPNALRGYLKGEIDKWTPILTAAGVKLE